jgi:PhnB protein
MARVSIYLNFMGSTEEAFTHYQSVFGGELAAFQRMGEIPAVPGQPPLAENEQAMVMHVELAILGGTVLMGTDMLESMGHELRVGNNVTLNLEPDDLAETQRLFEALAEGGTDVLPLQKMFWGAYWGTCCDRFGVRWMFNYADPSAA